MNALIMVALTIGCSVLLIFASFRATRAKVKKEINNWIELGKKYPDIKIQDGFDPIFYLVFNEKVDYLDSDNVIFYRYDDGITHCLKFDGDINDLVMNAISMNIVHIIINKKSVKFNVTSPVLAKIEILEE